jgi:hypothetical protein
MRLTTKSKVPGFLVEDAVATTAARRSARAVHAPSGDLWF